MAVNRNTILRKHETNGMGISTPPTLEFVIIFFDQKKESIEESTAFYNFYKLNGWTTIKGNKVRNWKTKANEWIWNKYHQTN